MGEVRTNVLLRLDILILKTLSPQSLRMSADVADSKRRAGAVFRLLESES
jgi:hypothetical protein